MNFNEVASLQNQEALDRDFDAIFSTRQGYHPQYRAHNPWMPSKADILRYKGGETLESIGADYNVSALTVVHGMRRAGVWEPRKGWNQYRRKGTR